MRELKRRRKKHVQFTIIASCLTFLVIAAGLGFGFKIVHDKQVKEAKIAAYQKLKKTAQSAEQLAYKKPTKENIEKVHTVSKQLKKKDQLVIDQKITQLETALNQIAAATAAVDQYRNDKSSKSLSVAELTVNKLTNAYEKSQKQTLTQQITDIKVKIAAEAAAKKLAELKDKKLIALTFDDGPNPQTTPQLLAELKAAEIHVTFFAIGDEAKANPEIIKAEAAAGDEVASHTWDHPELTTLSLMAQKKEILSAHDLINSISGQNTNIYRPPYGAYNDTTLSASTLTPILWSVDSNDWRVVNDTPQVVQNVVSSARDGAVVLLHDSHAWSVAAVPSIVSQLKARGYTFVTVSEMMAARPRWYVHDGKVYAGY